MDKIGLHLSCVQNELIQHPQQTLDFIYELGIRHLALPDVSKLKRLYPVLKGMGFQVEVANFPSPYITENWQPYTAFGNAKPEGVESFDDMLAIAVKYNLRYLIFPEIFPQDRGDLQWYGTFADKLNLAGEKCQQAGIQLCYHHHAFEFQPMEDSSPMQELLKYLDSKLVKLEFDVFWASLAGVDLRGFMDKHAEFMALLQFGDLGKDIPQSYKGITLPPAAYQPLGKGKVDFNEILSSKAEVPLYLINLQKSQDVLDELRHSVNYLKSLG
ncbi:TIM barrel protein [Porifericola rhodea]|uniref:sugar phosphate isomerase/epimerase family protein n=1 Tax=Porifericola rhodea TaxID=930972 RepID=UPI0026658480|nr:TIM barrel protein [Porifericola rhodea]WKN31149.1 TIM barrel protein [Porifericola rhodea]